MEGPDGGLEDESVEEDERGGAGFEWRIRVIFLNPWSSPIPI
jgi:hypothetical protein